MSEELRDEVEAINSIYGEGCLTVPEDEEVGAGEAVTYILKLPGEASSLRLRFPDSYPAETAPAVLGTHHSSGGKKGAGARDLGLFKEALEAVFQEGAVCLFDAIEEFSRRREEEEVGPETEESSLAMHHPDEHTAQDAGVAAAIEPAGASQNPAGLDRDGDIDLSSLPPPPWTLSETLTENRSTFIAHVAPISSPAQARLYLQQLLASDRRIRAATHNITAWRVRGAGGTSFQDCDDDGETAAGGRLLHLMQVMEVWDAMVVVTRWYGGVKLGPRRFAVINSVARDGFVRAGLVVVLDKEKKKRY